MIQSQIHVIGRRYAIALICVQSIWSTPTLAQHADVLVQDVDGRLTTGVANFETGAWTLGARVYSREFNSSYAVNDPGWNALATGSPSMPDGATALPAETDVGWDFPPMKIHGAVANLFYWDGTGDVAFDDLPAPGYELSLQARSGDFVAVDGSDQFVVGQVIEQTDELGGVHRHRFFFLDDGDDDLDTTPADGIYLFSIRLRMEGRLDRSQPVYFAFGTPSSTTTALADASDWARRHADQLTPDFDADFDGDLDVDGSDFLTWQRGRGTSGAAALQQFGDANWDDSIDAADLLVWESQFGSSLNSFTGVTADAERLSAIPELSTGWLASIGGVLLSIGRWKGWG